MPEIPEVRDTERPVLSLVMPAYNEEGAIAGVVREWSDELHRLRTPYEMRIYDDGSRDRTGEILGTLAAADPRIIAIAQANRGHGPTILRGYAEARGDWVAQVDSDGEIGAAAFGSLWARREVADLVLGYREGRSSPLARRIITGVSRLTVRFLFGHGVRDVNCPYRLFRRGILARLLPAVPPDAFAPNVILAGLAVRAGARIVEVPVPYTNRKTGTSSIVRWTLWRAAARSFAQTVRVALVRR